MFSERSCSWFSGIFHSMPGYRETGNWLSEYMLLSKGRRVESELLNTGITNREEVNAWLVTISRFLALFLPPDRKYMMMWCPWKSTLFFWVHVWRIALTECEKSHSEVGVSLSEGKEWMFVKRQPVRSASYSGICCRNIRDWLIWLHDSLAKPDILLSSGLCFKKHHFSVCVRCQSLASNLIIRW